MSHLPNFELSINTIGPMLHLSQLLGLAIGNHMCICSQVAREVETVELWALNESRHKARRQTLWARNLNGVSLSVARSYPWTQTPNLIVFLDTQYPYNPRTMMHYLWSNCTWCVNNIFSLFICDFVITITFDINVTMLPLIMICSRVGSRKQIMNSWSSTSNACKLALGSNRY